MSRVKGGTVTHARHKKVIKAAKGYYGRRKSTFKVDEFSKLVHLILLKI